MPTVFYAVLPYSKAEASLSEPSIISELQSGANENVLFFKSKESASHYCEIAQRQKYLYKAKEVKQAKKNHQIPSLIKAGTTNGQDPEKSDEFFSQFYEPLSSIPNEFLSSHEEEQAFLVLEVELKQNDFKNGWSSEETCYVISDYLDYQHQFISGPVILLNNKPFTIDPEEHKNFYLPCRKGPRHYILALRHAELHQIDGAPVQTIAFSPQYQKLTLLREYILDPSPEKLKIVTTVISSNELHALFNFLLNESINPELLLRGKDTLCSAYLLASKGKSELPNNPLQTQHESLPVTSPNHNEVVPPASSQPQKKPASLKQAWSALNLGWKVAIFVTLGLAAIVYLIIKHVKAKQKKQTNPSFQEKTDIKPIVLPKKIISIRQKKSKNKQPKSSLEIMQKEFDFNKVQQGMYKFWHHQATRAAKINHRSPAEKSRLYENTDAYRNHLQEKQTEPLSLNHRGELRKKIEFKDANTVVVTGTREQLKRWSLYADYANEKTLLTHESLDKKLDKSWIRSQITSRNTHLI